MKSEFWLDRWQQNVIGFHQHDINRHLRKYWSRRCADAGKKVFVPLCGKSSDLLWLRSKGHSVLGVEISPVAVEAFFAENQLQPMVKQQGAFQCWQADDLCILLGDFFLLSVVDLNQVAMVYDRAALIALPQTMRQRYVEHMAKVLPRPCQTLLLTMEYAQVQMDGPPFAVLQPEVEALYRSWCSVELLESVDVLADSVRFKERGLTSLTEKIYWLEKT